MRNLNYPTWESGIPHLMPEINPYKDTRSKMSFIWAKTSPNNPITFLINSGDSDVVMKLQDAWSYMEILQWLREQGYKIIERVDTNTHRYLKLEIWYYAPDTEGYEVHCIVSFGDYYNVLDEAIIYTLNLLKDE